MTIYIIQFINYTLSFFMWMILGRVVSVLLLGDRDNVIMALFRKVTDPVYAITKKIMPFAKEGWLPFLSIVLIVILRLLLIIIVSPGKGLE